MSKFKTIQKAIVVGFGNIALRHRQNLKFLFPNIKIFGVSSSGKIPSKKEECIDQIYLRLEDAIKTNVDLAIIASPASLHFIHAKKLIEAKVPCLIEKPVTINFQEGKKLLDLYKNSKVPVAVGYCLRYMPSALKMKKLIDQKLLGKIYNVFINSGKFLPDWRPAKKYQETVSAKKFLGGGVLLELSHEIDYIQWLLGSVKVEFSKLRFSKELELDVEDLADIIFQSKKEIFLCNLHLDFLQKKPQRTFSVIGEKGSLDWDLIDNTIKLNKKNSSKYLFSGTKWNSNQMYIDLLKDFLNLIEGKKNLTVDLEQAVKTIDLIDNIKRIAVQGNNI